jgi:hypothetical protein
MNPAPVRQNAVIKAGIEMGQRAWLAQRPLRLYDVADVVPGAGVTLCDALAAAQAPIVVTEREGSRSKRPGMLIGARVMAVAGGHQLSGAVYPFSMLSGRAMQEELRELLMQPSRHEEDNVLTMGLLIIKGWLAQYLRPAPSRASSSAAMLIGSTSRSRP